MYVSRLVYHVVINQSARSLIFCVIPLVKQGIYVPLFDLLYVDFHVSKVAKRGATNFSWLDTAANKMATAAAAVRQRQLSLDTLGLNITTYIEARDTL